MAEANRSDLTAKRRPPRPREEPAPVERELVELVAEPLYWPALL
jgi:hypothetical protein